MGGGEEKFIGPKVRKDMRWGELAKSRVGLQNEVPPTPVAGIEDFLPCILSRCLCFSLYVDFPFLLVQE